MLVFLLFALDLGKSTKAGLYTPLLFPPGVPRIPPDRPQEGGASSPFFDQNSHRFLVSIFGRFGAVLGPSWGVIFGPLEPPSSLKMASRGVLKAYLCQKRRFCSHTTFSNTKTAFWTPRRRPKRPKIGPRRLQGSIEEHFWGSSKSYQILHRFQCRLGSIWGAKMGAQKLGCPPPLLASRWQLKLIFF